MRRLLHQLRRLAALLHLSALLHWFVHFSPRREPRQDELTALLTSRRILTYSIIVSTGVCISALWVSSHRKSGTVSGDAEIRIDNVFKGNWAVLSAEPSTQQAAVEALASADRWNQARITVLLGSQTEPAPGVISHLADQLNDTDLFRRARAAHALRRLSENSVIEPAAKDEFQKAERLLARCLEEENIHVQRDAAMVLGILAALAEQTQLVLIKQCDSTDAELRTICARTVARLRSSQNQGELAFLELFKNSHDEVPIAILDELSEITVSDPHLLEAIVTCLSHRSVAVQRKATDLLERCGSAGYEPLTTAVALGGMPRQSALRVLSKLSNPPQKTVQALDQVLLSDDEQSVLLALEAIAQWGPAGSAAAPSVKTLLASTNHQIRVRSFVAFASLNIDAPAALKVARDMSDTLTIADIEMVLRGLMAIAQQDSGALDEIARLMGRPEFQETVLRQVALLEPQLLQELLSKSSRHESPIVRKGTANLAAVASQTERLNILKQLTGDESAEVRLAALQKCVEAAMADQDVRQLLKKSIDDTVGAIRLFAVNRLNDNEIAQLSPEQIGRLLRDTTDPQIPIQTARRIRGIVAPEPVIVEALAEMACCNLTKSVNAALDTLQSFGKSAASVTPQLVEALSPADAQLRLRLLNTIVAIGTEGTVQVPMVRKHLADQDVSVQVEAAKLLLKMNAEQQAAAVALQSILTSGTSRQRLEAAGLLIQSRVELASVPEALVGILQPDTASENERFRAARLLNRLGIQAVAATPTLLKVLHDDPDDRVRNEAFYALLDLGETAMPWYEEELRKDRKGYGISAAFMISKLQRASPAAIKELTRIGCNPEVQTEVRIGCVKALSELGPLAQAAAPRLTMILSEHEPQIDDRARHPTSAEGLADAFAYFYKGAELPQQDLRLSAVEALGRMNDRSVIPELMIVAKSTPNEVVRFDWDTLRFLLQRASTTIRSALFVSNFVQLLSMCAVAWLAALSCLALISSFTGGRRQNAAIRGSGVCLALGTAVLPTALAKTHEASWLTILLAVFLGGCAISLLGLLLISLREGLYIRQWFVWSLRAVAISIVWLLPVTESGFERGVSLISVIASVPIGIGVATAWYALHRLNKALGKPWIYSFWIALAGSLAFSNCVLMSLTTTPTSSFITYMRDEGLIVLMQVFAATVGMLLAVRIAEASKMVADWTDAITDLIFGLLIVGSKSLSFIASQELGMKSSSIPGAVVLATLLALGLVCAMLQKYHRLQKVLLLVSPAMVSVVTFACVIYLAAHVGSYVKLSDEITVREKMRSAAVQSLVKLGGDQKEVTAAAIRILDDYEVVYGRAREYMALTECLTQLGDAGRDALLEMLEKGNYEKRLIAACLVTKLTPDAKLVKQLEDKLSDKAKRQDWYGWLALALCQTRPNDMAYDQLLWFVERLVNQENTRSNCGVDLSPLILALRSMPSLRERAIPILEPALASRDDELVVAAGQVLADWQKLPISAHDRILDIARNPQRFVLMGKESEATSESAIEIIGAFDLPREERITLLKSVFAEAKTYQQRLAALRTIGRLVAKEDEQVEWLRTIAENEGTFEHELVKAAQEILHSLYAQ